MHCRRIHPNLVSYDLLIILLWVKRLRPPLFLLVFINAHYPTDRE